MAGGQQPAAEAAEAGPQQQRPHPRSTRRAGSLRVGGSIRLVGLVGGHPLLSGDPRLRLGVRQGALVRLGQRFGEERGTRRCARTTSSSTAYRVTWAWIANQARSPITVANAPYTHARIARTSMAEVTLDEFDIGFDLTYDVDPLGRIAVCAVRAGSFPAARVRGLVGVVRPGCDVLAR